MANSELLKTISLSGTDKGVISISNVNEPYGEGTNSVVSVGVSLNGDENNPEWKAHIPYANIDEVIEALKEAKEKFGK